jgi:hypothetical protein
MLRRVASKQQGPIGNDRKKGRGKRSGKGKGPGKADAGLCYLAGGAEVEMPASMSWRAWSWSLVMRTTAVVPQLASKLSFCFM